MRQKAGYTLMELMVSIVIVGILTASAMRLYGTYRQRTYGAEASIMVKQIMDAQITYFLENSKFFPDGVTYELYHTGESKPAGIDVRAKIAEALNIEIPEGHRLDYYIAGYNDPGNESSTVVISADFPLFHGGLYNQIIGSVDATGEVTVFIPGKP